MELNSEEIGASCQQAQALSEGEPALALKGFSQEWAIVVIPNFQPGGFRCPQDQLFGCGVLIMAKGSGGRNLGGLALGRLPKWEEGGDSQGVP